MRQGVPNVPHLEQSYLRIVPKLSNDDANRPLVALILGDQVIRCKDSLH